MTNWYQADDTNGNNRVRETDEFTDLSRLSPATSDDRWPKSLLSMLKVVLSASETAWLSIVDGAPRVSIAPVIVAEVGEEISLIATVSDDGLPLPTPTITWSQTAGPNGVSILEPSLSHRPRHMS